MLGGGDLAIYLTFYVLIFRIGKEMGVTDFLNPNESKKPVHQVKEEISERIFD